MQIQPLRHPSPNPRPKDISFGIYKGHRPTAYGFIYVNGKKFTSNQGNAGESTYWNNTLILLNKNYTFYATDYGLDSSDFLNHLYPLKGAN